MIRIGDLPLAGQQMAHVSDITPAHGVGLAGQAERAAPGLADLPGGQVKIDDGVGGVRSRHALINAHGPERNQPA